MTASLGSPGVLQETEEVLKKELSGLGDDSIVSLHSISAVGQRCVRDFIGYR